MNPRSKESYANFGFTTAIFVFTYFVFEKIIFQSTSNRILIGGLSGMMAGIAAFSISYFIKNYHWLIKLIITIVYSILLFALGVNIDKGTANVSESIIGKWITKNDTIVLKLEITPKILKMQFIPDSTVRNFQYKKDMIYDYEVNADTVSMSSKSNANFFEWKVLKLTKDSLIVKDEDGEVFKFVSMK
jgi:hypothetical protein